MKCGVWSEERGGQKLKLMQETNQGQGSVGECVWTLAAKTAHLYIEFEFQGWGVWCLYLSVPTSCTKYLPIGSYVCFAIWRQGTGYSYYFIHQVCTLFTCSTFHVSILWSMSKLIMDALGFLDSNDVGFSSVWNHRQTLSLVCIKMPLFQIFPNASQLKKAWTQNTVNWQPMK